MPGVLPPQGTVFPKWVPLRTHQEIVAGDDCRLVDGRALFWESPSWPNLAGSVLTMVIGHPRPRLYGWLPVTWTGAVEALRPSPSTICLEVTAAQTAALAADMYSYTLSAKLPSGHVVTVAVGKLTVRAAPGALPFV